MAAKLRVLVVSLDFELFWGVRDNRLLAKVKLKFDLSIDEAHNYK